MGNIKIRRDVRLQLYWRELTIYTINRLVGCKIANHLNALVIFGHENMHSFSQCAVTCRLNRYNAWNQRIILNEITRFTDNDCIWNRYERNEITSKYTTQKQNKKRKNSKPILKFDTPFRYAIDFKVAKKKCCFRICFNMWKKVEFAMTIFSSG